MTDSLQDWGSRPVRPTEPEESDDPSKHPAKLDPPPADTSDEAQDLPEELQEEEDIEVEDRGATGGASLPRPAGPGFWQRLSARERPSAAPKEQPQQPTEQQESARPDKEAEPPSPYVGAQRPSEQAPHPGAPPARTGREPGAPQQPYHQSSQSVPPLSSYRPEPKPAPPARQPVERQLRQQPPTAANVPRDVAPARPPYSQQPVVPPPVQPPPNVRGAGQPPRRGSQVSPAQQRGGCARFGTTLLVIFAVVALLFGTVMVGYASIARDLPPADELQARASSFASTLIYDRKGQILNEVADPSYGRRTVVEIDQISPYVIDATIATEDPNFYSHPGVDPVGIARAVYYAIRERDLSGPGGSTITQQLVKLTFLTSEKSISRKVKEAILAAEITRRYDKDTILRIYLNELNYGNLAYGIEAAAETYFGKHASDLTLAEAAMLAGLPQAPAYYDPYTKLWEADGQPGAVKRRQGVVLRLMVENGFISNSQADAAWAEELVLQPLRQVYDSRHPHFVLYTRSQIEELVGPELANRGGLKIYTTLDPDLQVAAEESVKNQVTQLANQGAHNGAVVAVRPNTGEVLAMVGSADFNNVDISGQINMAIQPRQPGSALKPFVYLASFEMPASVSTDPAEAQTALQARLAGLSTTPVPGQEASTTELPSAIEPPGYWTPGTVIMDITTEFPDPNGPYKPTNYDGKEHGLVSVRTALANSLNIPAVKALQHVGLDRLKDTARRAGITTLTRADYGLSLALGGGEVTLLELTGAYATLANGGMRVPVSPVACVLDAEGRLIWRGTAAQDVQGCLGASGDAATGVAITPQPSEQAFTPQHIYLITSILSDVQARRVMFGSAENVMTVADRAVAVKTGTTNDYRDAWTMGYTPNLAVGVWVGNADYTEMQRLAGSLGAAPVWHDVMVSGLHATAPTQFPAPQGMGTASICTDSGTQPSEACPGDRRRDEIFVANQGPLPPGYDLWQRVRVDRVTGQLANEFTPADRVEERNVMIFPERYRAWAEANGYPVLAPQRAALAFEPELVLRWPVSGTLESNTVVLQALVRIPEPLIWRLEYGVGPNPIGWGILSGPHPIDPGDPLSRDIDGDLGEWDIAATAAQHGANDFTLRLAAYYDVTQTDYPVAASAPVYVVFEAATPTPTETPTDTPTPELTPTETPTILPTITPTVVTEPPTATPTVQIVPPTVEPATAVPPSGLVQAVVTYPNPGQQLNGPVDVIGVADGSGFAGYQLDFALGEAPSDVEWIPVGLASTTPVNDGLLATWNTAGLSPGVYTLRLRVYDITGSYIDTLVTAQLVAP